MFSALYQYWLKSKVQYSRLYIMFYTFPLHVPHVPLTCSTCSSCMFCMFLLHVQHVQRTCSACTSCLFSMFKVDVLLVPFACSVCHFTFTLRTSVSHNSLKSSPIYTIFIYLSSLYWDLDVHIACEEILWIFYPAVFGSAKQLSTYNFLIPPYNRIKQLVKWDISEISKSQQDIEAEGLNQ